MIDLSQDFELKDAVARLRPMRAGDHPVLLPFGLSEPGLFRYSPVRPIGAEDLTRYMALALEGRAQGTSYPFVVIDERTGEVAGSTRYYDIQPTNASLHIGYTWYASRFHGTGLNVHCKFLMLRHAFEVWDMVRVEFQADARNERSIAAMKRIGCTVEGVLRSHLPDPDGGRRDSIVLSILRDEWPGRVKAGLEQLMGAYRAGSLVTRKPAR